MKCLTFKSQWITDYGILCTSVLINSHKIRKTGLPTRRPAANPRATIAGHSQRPHMRAFV